MLCLLRIRYSQMMKKKKGNYKHNDISGIKNINGKFDNMTFLIYKVSIIAKYVISYQTVFF